MAAMLGPAGPINGTAYAGQAEPAVPAGRDPGGHPVALLGTGVDYTKPEIAQRLARDGEGEIIGFDFVDDDRQPFATPGDTEAASLLAGEGQAATLVVLRADANKIVSFGRAMGYAAKSPALIIAVVAPVTSGQVALVVETAARKFPRNLFIVAAGDGGEDIDRVVKNPDAPNLMIVTAADAVGQLVAPANHGAKAVSLAISLAPPRTTGSATNVPSERPSQSAVARAAALAARISAAEPQLTGADIKARILTLVAKSPQPAPATTRGGFIAEPWRHFWLE